MHMADLLCCTTETNSIVKQLYSSKDVLKKKKSLQPNIQLRFNWQLPLLLDTLLGDPSLRANCPTLLYHTEDLNICIMAEKICSSSTRCGHEDRPNEDAPHPSKSKGWDFPGGAVVKNPPANAGDTGSSPGLGRSHMPWSN